MYNKNKNCNTMILKDFQKTLLHSLNECRFSLIKHSRQIGVSTVLKEFIIKTLLKENDVTIILFSETYASGKEFLNKIRLDKRIISSKKIADSISKLVLENGNMIKIASNLDGLRGCKYTHVVIDNGCFINKLETILSNIIPIITSLENSKLIIASSNKKGYSYFNQLFNDDKNIFTKTKLHWSIDEENIGKYEKLKNQVEPETFKIEMELEDILEIKSNKDHLLSFRISDELYVALTKKLLDLDLSLSEYLRTLIKKDTNE